MGRVYRVMIIYDVSKVHATTGKEYGWAYWRRANALKRYAPADFHVDTFAYADVPWSHCGFYDLIFNLQYDSPSRKRIKGHSPKREVPLVISYNADSRRKTEQWARVRKEADWIICNNLEVFDHWRRAPNTCCISNGVDTEIFRPITPISEREHRVVWTGSSGKGKGFVEVLTPLVDRLSAEGFGCSFRPINRMEDHVVYETSDQVKWYNTGSYVVCASASEGTPGIITEGVACGCVPVTVPIGNVLEWGKDGENCILVERTVDSFLAGLNRAREKREELSAAGVQLMHGSWSYGGGRANFYFQLFRRIIADGTKAIEPFAYSEKAWEEI